MERRDPTLTELRLVDTYWSDHCRHTTFGTHIDTVEVEDAQVRQAYEEYLSARREVYGQEAQSRPQTLMDIATIGAKLLRKRGLLPQLDLSEEVNASSIHVDAEIDGKTQDWLLMFKNETHNHPTEIEPYGGAATCIGGAIRDPLSGRAYVYQAMRLTGAGDPFTPLSETPPGKLPQKKLTVTAAQGYSSYGNQIGIATGLVQELYHPGYAAKRMEVGAVVGAVPAANVVRLPPEPGDAVILLGGRTGRDGVGGATGSSKSHTEQSLETCAAEVQKGNAPEERKMQRLFRNPKVTRMIKRCNDFGAGGVSVAIGELADGLVVDLDAVRKKYDGLDGTELAISESQERLAVVTAPEDADAFIAAAEAENLEAYRVAEVSAIPRMVMTWNGQTVADLPRSFLNSNGTAKHTAVRVPAYPAYGGPEFAGSAGERLRSLAGDLRFCSQRGLGERFDGSIGSASVLMPRGGKYQLTPAQVMAALLPAEGDVQTCSLMSFGCDPHHGSVNPYTAAEYAVTVSAAKLVAAGCSPDKICLSLQEYFERLRKEPLRWGKPFASLLGALRAQLDLGIAAVGGKDSMSGSYLDRDVPPTLISFAVAPCRAELVLSPEFKEPGRPVVLFPGGTKRELKKSWDLFCRQNAEGKIRAAWAVAEGGAAEGLMKMAFGNGIGFRSESFLSVPLFCPLPGAILAECTEAIPRTILLGYTSELPELTLEGDTVSLDELRSIWEGRLEPIFPTRTETPEEIPSVPLYTRRPGARKSPAAARPRAVIPVFPGTNCEFDTAEACRRAGIEPEILLIRNLTPALLDESAAQLQRSILRSQILILPGGFSGGDEPDGAGKFIAAFFRNPRIADAVSILLRERDGLILGICNGFQALIKLGLVPFGEIRPMDAHCPTLSFNRIGRHQSRYVTTRVTSVRSPWLSLCEPGELHTLPVSHGKADLSRSRSFSPNSRKTGRLPRSTPARTGCPPWISTITRTAPCGRWRALRAPTGACWGKWLIRSVRGPGWRKTFPAASISPSSRAARRISDRKAHRVSRAQED